MGRKAGMAIKEPGDAACAHRLTCGGWLGGTPFIHLPPCASPPFAILSRGLTNR